MVNNNYLNRIIRQIVAQLCDILICNCNGTWVYLYVKSFGKKSILLRTAYNSYFTIWLDVGKLILLKQIIEVLVKNICHHLNSKEMVIFIDLDNKCCSGKRQVSSLIRFISLSQHVFRLFILSHFAPVVMFVKKIYVKTKVMSHAVVWRRNSLITTYQEVNDPFWSTYMLRWWNRALCRKICCLPEQQFFNDQSYSEGCLVTFTSHFHPWIFLITFFGSLFLSVKKTWHNLYEGWWNVINKHTTIKK